VTKCYPVRLFYCPGEKEDTVQVESQASSAMRVENEWGHGLDMHEGQQQLLNTLDKNLGAGNSPPKITALFLSFSMDMVMLIRFFGSRQLNFRFCHHDHFMLITSGQTNVYCSIISFHSQSLCEICMRIHQQYVRPFFTSTGKLK
jgi:hypothetical protein